MSNRPKRWTQKETKKLIDAYTRGGTALAHIVLPHRTTRSIKTKAQSLMLQAGIPDGYIEAVRVHASEAGRRANKYMLSQARKDGVLRSDPGTWIRYTVPIEWAEEYTRKLEAQLDEAEEVKNWWTTPRLAHEMNVARSYLTRGFKKNERIAREINAQVEIKTITYPREQIYFHPQQAQAFAKRYIKHMTCPNCKHPKTRVIHTRKQGPENLRRRKCEACNHRFQTVELPTKELTHKLINT